MVFYEELRLQYQINQKLLETCIPYFKRRQCFPPKQLWSTVL